MTREDQEQCLAELRRELLACPATGAGYREAGRLRSKIQALKKSLGHGEVSK